MKEEDAKTKWCPMVRKELHCTGPINRWDGEVYEYSEEFRCITSECMMWRTTSEFLTDGFCGLGGKP